MNDASSQIMPAAKIMSHASTSQRGTLMRVESLQSLYEWSGRVYVFAVVIGAAASFGLWQFGKQLSIIQDSQIATLGASAEQLRKDNLNLESQIASAHKAVATAQADVAAANERTAQLEIQAAAAQKEAAAAQIEATRANDLAVRIQRAAAWRVIPPQTAAALVAGLTKGPGGAVTLSYLANDPETLFLAIQITNAFESADKAAGKPLWTIRVEPRIYSRAIYWGLRIIGQNDTLVTSIREVFRSVDLTYGTDPVPNVINDSPGMTIGGGPLPDAMIFVGPKLPPS
jgi:hypothetical protein